MVQDQTKTQGAKKQLLDKITALEQSLSELRRELAQTQDKADTSTFDVLCFVVKERTYAVFLSDVAEVLRMVKYSPLPKAPPDIQGVINCRGVMLPILNPGGLLAEGEIEASLSASLVVITAAGQRIALIVEQVVGVQTFLARELVDVSHEQKAHKTLPPFVLGFIRHAGNHVTLIDVNQLLGFEDRRSLDSALRERDEWGQG